MKKITTIEQLMEELEKNGYFGVRGASEHDIELINNGRDYLDVSYDVPDGIVDWDNPLNGTCALGINEYMNTEEVAQRVSDAKAYAYDTGVILLIGDSYQEYGNDENEVILGHNGYGADIIAVVEI